MPTSNGKITAPISIEDIRKCLGDASNDVGQLCRSAKINKWSKYKPVKCTGMASPASKTDWQNLRWGFEIPTIQLNTSGAALKNTDVTWKYIRPTGGMASPYRLSDFEWYGHNAPPFITLSDIPDTLGNAFFSVTFYFNQEEANGGLIPSDLVITNVGTASGLYAGFALYRDPDTFSDGKLALLYTSQKTIGTNNTLTIPAMQFSTLTAGKYYAVLFLSPVSFLYGTALPTTLPSNNVAIIEGGLKSIILDTSDMNVGLVLWGRAMKLSGSSTQPNTSYYSAGSGSSVSKDASGYWYVAFTSSGGGASLIPNRTNLGALNDKRRMITLEPIAGHMGIGQYNPMADGRNGASLIIGLCSYYTSAYTDGVLIGLKYTRTSMTQNAQTKNWTYKWRRSIVVIDMEDYSVVSNGGEISLGDPFACTAVVTEGGQVSSFTCPEINLLEVANIVNGAGSSQSVRGLKIHVKGNRQGSIYDEVSAQVNNSGVSIPEDENLAFNPYTGIAGFYYMPNGWAYVDVTVDTL